MESNMTTTIENVIKTYFMREYNGKLVPCYIPIDVANKTHLRNNLTLEQLATLWETGKVSYETKTGKTMTYKKPTDNINGYSLFYKHIEEPLYCLDIDGVWCEEHYNDQENPEIAECAECSDRRNNVRDFVEEQLTFVADCPYTLSTNKKYPHFICKIIGLPEYKQEVKILNDEYCIEADLIKFDKTITERKGNIVYNIDTDNFQILEYHWNDISKYFNTKRMGFKNEEIKKQETKKEEQKKYENPNVLYMKYYDLAMCCDMKRFGEYTSWFQLACILKSIEDSEEMFEVFDEISSKSKNYNGSEDCRTQWDKCNNDVVNGLTVASLRLWAKCDNPTAYNQWYEKYIVNSIENLVKDYDFNNLAKYFYNLKPNNYVVKGDGDNNIWYTLQSNNSWVCSSKPVGLLSDLTNTVKAEIKEYVNFLPLDNPNVLKAIQASKNIGNHADKCFKYLVEPDCYLNNTIDFDTNWQLFGFNNCVLDLESHKFRDYKYSDYISIKTGYDWREPTDEELDTVNSLLEKIMPNVEERKFLLQLYSTGLEGRTLENFIVLNGEGGNGKGLIDDFLLIAFGDYGTMIDNGVLTKPFETGADPKAYIMKNKRFVVCREPKAARKLCNATVKEITGGSTIPVRDLYSSNCKTPICPTLFMECNKKPLFEEAPQDAEARRIIDINFGSSFVKDKDNVDEQNNIYLANQLYKNTEWQQKHKYAIIKLLINAHQEYAKNNYCFEMPLSVKKRTEKYLQSSFSVFNWFEENYTEITGYVMPKTKEEKIKIIKEQKHIKLSTLFSHYKHSEDYKNLDKLEKANMTKEKFTVAFMKSPCYAKKCLNVDITDDNGKRIHDRECIFGYVENLEN